MRNAVNAFCALIDQTSFSEGLYCYLKEQKVPIDASDLLRWQWVLSISALDKYIHDVVRIGMIQEFLGTRSKTDKFNAFRIDMGKYLNIANSPSPESEFEKEIIRQHSILAFQHPDKISDALSFIWSEQHKWEVISNNMATPISAKDLKTKLINVVTRRNQIVHEGDCFSSCLPLQQQPISESDVYDVVTFVKEIVQAIQKSIP